MNVQPVLRAPLLAALPIPTRLADTPRNAARICWKSGMRMAGWEQHCQFNAGVAPPCVPPIGVKQRLPRHHQGRLR